MSIPNVGGRSVSRKPTNALRTVNCKNGLIERFGKRVPALAAMMGLILMLATTYEPRPGLAFDESISTFASADCSTPKTEWNLGETACAVATDAPDGRRIAWVAPSGEIADLGGTFTGTASDTYTIEATGPLAQVGTWTVTTIDNNGVAFSVAEFVVRDPANASANLAVSNFAPFQTSAGNDITFRIELTNTGPDDAQDVVLTSAAPVNATFVSETQDSGPAFSCTSPPFGSANGTISCQITSLPPRTTAVFSLVFNVNSGTANGVVISNTATAESDTNELHPADNSATAPSTVVGAASDCTITCPSVAQVNTPQCSAVVTYSAPTTSGDCGSNPEGGSGVVCSPPSGSTFPVGTTTVNCTTATGDTCSFAVTVNFTGPSETLSITCPGNVNISEEDPSGGTARVNYPSPTATGSCVSVSCIPPSGSIFQLGTTVVTCTATDSQNNSETCSFTVTVVSGAGCAISCPGDISETAASGQCSAVVTYPSPTASGECGTVTCSPPSGSVFQAGATLVTCTTTAGLDCSFTVTVVSSNPLTALGTAPVWVGLKNSDDVGTKFDLLAEVLRNGAVIGSGQVNDVPGGSSGFNNAVLSIINLVLDGAADICSGDTVGFRLSVRVAASSGHVSGTARLWYNDAAANSRFNATIGGMTNDYFLLDGFVLNTAAGPGPKRTIDVLVNRNVGGNPFRPFGTWSKTF